MEASSDIMKGTAGQCGWQRRKAQKARVSHHRSSTHVGRKARQVDGVLVRRAVHFEVEEGEFNWRAGLAAQRSPHESSVDLLDVLLRVDCAVRRQKRRNYLNVAGAGGRVVAGRARARGCTRDAGLCLRRRDVLLKHEVPRDTKGARRAVNRTELR
ncbi:hypothetical protein T492DRAFT_1119005 [Pavlovales sp. CCMP2436]|nr:hypothetical protein T492DRAFT_1119005 [Pavlovales sp. CCMP2436]